MAKSLYTLRYEKLRELLAEYRERAGLTQKEVAEHLGRPQSYVSKSETGERRIDICELIDFADAIGFDPVRVIRQLRKIRG